MLLCRILRFMLEKLDEETHYQLLKYLDENSNISQRELAQKMGVSLGKVNYCLKALINVGQVKLINFANSNHKLGYAYYLTPIGIKEKTKITIRFLEFKKQQYELVKQEICRLHEELSIIQNEGSS